MTFQRFWAVTVFGLGTQNLPKKADDCSVGLMKQSDLLAGGEGDVFELQTQEASCEASVRHGGARLAQAFPRRFYQIVLVAFWSVYYNQDITKPRKWIRRPIIQKRKENNEMYNLYRCVPVHLSIPMLWYLKRYSNVGCDLQLYRYEKPLKAHGVLLFLYIKPLFVPSDVGTPQCPVLFFDPSRCLWCLRDKHRDSFISHDGSKPGDAHHSPAEGGDLVDYSIPHPPNKLIFQCKLEVQQTDQTLGLGITFFHTANTKTTFRRLHQLC